EETVRQFLKRYQIDVRQAARVRRLALHFFKRLNIQKSQKTEVMKRLGWAADLHEIGISIAHDDYHKHGAYILQHADMPGFSNDDQLVLATFVLGHQTKISKLKTREPTRAKWLALLCLRLAVLLSRRREDLARVPLKLEADGDQIQIHVEQTWLKTHALSEYSLRTEIC